MPGDVVERWTGGIPASLVALSWFYTVCVVRCARSFVKHCKHADAICRRSSNRIQPRSATKTSHG